MSAATRPPRRGVAAVSKRGVAAVALVVVPAAVLAAAVVASITVWRATAGGPPCTVRVAGSERGLSRADARLLTAAAATASKQRGALRSLASTAAVGGDLALARALLGLDGPALRCRSGGSSALGAEPEGGSGLTSRAQAVLDGVRAAFGDVPAGGFAPGGVTTGHMPGSAHYDGRAIDFFYRPVTPGSTARGWVLAQWLVARNDTLHLATVIFSDRIWNLRGARAGWRDYAPPRGDPRNPVLRHLDHVHVDVRRGG